MISEPKKTYKFITVLGSDNNRYLDDSQVDISLFFESSDPITLGRYK